MSEWKKISFADLGETIRGVSYKPSDLREEPSAASVTLLRSNNIKEGSLNFKDLQFVVEGTVRDNQLMISSDIAICMSNGNRALVGKSGQFQNRADSLEYTVGAFCSIFRPNKNHDPDFVRHQFGSESYQRHLDVILAGSAINNLKGSDIQEIVVQCPESKPEQTKIAEILSTVDRAIEQTEALIAKQQRLKTGLMQDLLTRGIDEYGNLRTEQTHEFKDSPLGRIPVEWEVKPIETKLECIIDYRGRTPVKTDSGIPLITAKNVRDGYLCEEPREFIALDAYGSWMTRGFPEPGDVMITTEAPMGNVARVPDYKMALAQRLITLPTKKGELASDYLFWMLHWTRTLERLELLTSGSTVVGIKQSIFRKVEFCFPPIEEQLRIATLLNAEKDTGESNLKHLAKLRSLKTALMQDLLTGRKRVTDLLTTEEDQP